MAALAFKSRGSGRMPALGGVTKVPGPGLKIKYGTLTADTDYPDDGYTAATIATLVGFTRVEAVIPCGPFVFASGESGYASGWDFETRTLRAFGLPALDGNALAAGAAFAEATTGENNLDGATIAICVIGY